MYFDEIELPQLKDIILSKDQYFAHVPRIQPWDRAPEPLEDHTNLVLWYFRTVIVEKGLEDALLRIEEKLLIQATREEIQLFREMILSIPLFHDTGKINPLFQSQNMQNKFTTDSGLFKSISSKHSMLSSVIYLNYYRPKIQNLEKSRRKKMRYFLYLNAFVIARHHTNFDCFERFLGQFDADQDGDKVLRILSIESDKILSEPFQLERDSVPRDIKKIRKNLEQVSDGTITYEETIAIYTYARLLYSILLASDYYATNEYSKQKKMTEFGNLSDIQTFAEEYHAQKRYQGIRKYEEGIKKNSVDHTQYQPINILRNDLFLEAEQNLRKNFEESLFFLEAPTGAGKSNVAMNLSFQFLEQDSKLRKIIYVYPFNTLIEQNKNTMEEIFHNPTVLDQIVVVNSVTPIKSVVNEGKEEPEATEDNEKLYAKDLLNRQFLNYPFILTSSVSLFHTMFDFNQSNVFGFHQLVNSVIVLDEIQSYRNKIWNEMIHFLHAFAELLNIKVVIMSATLPDLSYFIEGQELPVRLITNWKKYFMDPIFCNRVKLHYELLDSTNIMEDLRGKVIECAGYKKKLLIEFISKKSAFEFYTTLMEEKEQGTILCDIYLMSGDDSIIERKKILTNAKKEQTNGVILVATQVVEAGIDIDMDLGFKDISILDSEEQFLGRINRSCLRKGEVYFFNKDNTASIYHGDVRNNKKFSIATQEMRRILENKQFGEYYQLIMEQIRLKYNECHDEKDNVDVFFRKSVFSVNVIKISEHMKLIEDNNNRMTVCLARTIRDGERLMDGMSVWNQYKDLLNDTKMDYAKKQIQLSQVMADLNYFLYEVRKGANISFNEQIGEIYLIENGEEYFTNGKLDREKLENGSIFVDL